VTGLAIPMGGFIAFFADNRIGFELASENIVGINDNVVSINNDQRFLQMVEYVLIVGTTH
jgi:hypothetical protein